jgi:hypothetical protein
MSILPVGRRHRARRRIRLLGAAAGATSVLLVSSELTRLVRRGTPREAVAALREGYRAGPANEASVLSLFLSFGLTFASARAVTGMIRSGRGPLRDIRIGKRHIHHFVPGILACLLAGGASIALRHEEIDRWLAIPFGAGAALVLDEAALLLELEDVYWSEEGLLSVEIGLGTVALLGTLGVVLRMLLRGERRLSA